MGKINVSYPKTDENPKGLPLPKQAMFHSLPHKYRLFAGGFGTGKTTSLGMEVLKQSMTYPRNYGVLARKDLQELKSTTLKDFFEICPEGVISNHDKQNKTITFINDSQVYYMNLDSSREAERKIKSLNLGFVAIDQLEEIEENVFLAFIGRLRRKNTARCFIGSCNTAGHNWLWNKWVECPYETFVKLIELEPNEAKEICQTIQKRIDLSLIDRDEHSLNAGTKREIDIYSGFGMPIELAKALYEKSNYGLIEATTFDNPYLPPDYVDQLLKYPKNWVKRYVYCSWDDFEGLVYKEYSDVRNKIDEYEPLKGESLYIVMDYGYRNPTAIGFYSVDYDGTARLYKEFYESGRQIAEISAYIKSHPEWESAYKLADPSIWNVQRDGISVGAEFAAKGIYFERADNSVLQGVDKVNEYFKESKLFIAKNCVHTIKEIGNYKWKEIKPGQNRNAYEEPVKKNDHMCDNIRYFINHVYTPVRKNESVVPQQRGTDSGRNSGTNMNNIARIYGNGNIYSSYD